MKWYKVFNSNVPQVKRDPLTAFMIGSSIINGIGSMVSQQDANRANIALSRESREWQSQENQKNRDWQEMMWNQQNEYNSPANQRLLAEEAGYNPYLLGEKSLGSSAGDVGSPSMVGAPQTAHVNPVNPMPAMTDTLSQMLPIINQRDQVQSNVDFQKAKQIQTMAQTAIDAYDKLGYKGYKEVMDTLSPVLAQINLQDSRSDIMFSEILKNYLSDRYNKDMDSLNKEWQYELGKKYGEQQIQSALSKIEFEISESVGRLNSMQVQNEAVIKQTAADLVVKAAQALNLKKVGDKYEADAKTANLLRNTFNRILKGKATQEEVNAYFATAAKDSSIDLVGYQTSLEGRDAILREYQNTHKWRSNALLGAVDRFFGQWIKLSPASAGSYGLTTSYSGSEYGNTVFGLTP